MEKEKNQTYFEMMKQMSPYEVKTATPKPIEKKISRSDKNKKSEDAKDDKN